MSAIIGGGKLPLIIRRPRSRMMMMATAFPTTITHHHTTTTTTRRSFLYRSLSSSSSPSTADLKQRSKLLTGDPSIAPHMPGSYAKKTSMARGNLRAIGWKDEDFVKPIITVGSPWTNANPCNDRVRELTDLVCEAIEEEGGKAFVAPTPVISDGMTNGARSMRYSLISRDYRGLHRDDA